MVYLTVGNINDPYKMAELIEMSFGLLIPQSSRNHMYYRPMGRDTFERDNISILICQSLMQSVVALNFFNEKLHMLFICVFHFGFIKCF